MADRSSDMHSVRTVLATMLGGSGVDSIVPIAGGLSGRSYLVTAARASYVAKRTETGTDALLGLEVQFDLLERLAHEDLVPPPIGFDLAHGILVSEFLPGSRSLTVAEVSKPENILSIAMFLKRLHAQAFDLPEFDPARHARAYLSSIGGRDRLDPAERNLGDELETLAEGYARQYPPTVICHNDLVAANILMTDKGLRLIDFEYAAASSSVLDLASLAEMNDLRDRNQQALLAAYADAESEPYSRAEFAKVRRLVALLAHFWARARSGVESPAVRAFLQGQSGAQQQ